MYLKIYESEWDEKKPHSPSSRGTVPWKREEDKDVLIEDEEE